MGLPSPANQAGSKEGRAEGECGACTVVMVRSHGGLLLLPAVAGQEIYTMEALASGGELYEAQRAMASAGGLVELDGPATPERVYWAIQRSAQPEIAEPAAEAVRI